MKWVFMIMPLFILSCSQTPKTLRVQDASADAFYEESFLRYDQRRLGQKQNMNNPLIQGEVLCYQKKFQEGLQLLATQLERHKDRPAYWNHLAVCYILMEQYPLALFNLEMGMSQKARELEYAPLYNNRALIYQRQRHYSWALSDYKEALKKAPRALSPRYNLAQLYLQFGHYQKAHQELFALHQHFPKDQEITAHLALIHLAYGEHEKALKLLEALDDSYLQRSDLAASIALLYLEQQRPEDAKKILLRQELTRDPRVRAMSLRVQQRINLAMEAQRQERQPAQLNQ